MRMTLLTFLASSALLVSAAEVDRDTIDTETSVAIGKPECVYNAIRDSPIDCDVDGILECFEEETDKEILDRIQQCLLSSGCVSDEAEEESLIWADNEEYRELRRRADSSASSDDSSAAAATTESTAASTTVDSSTTASSASSSASAAASTTVASSTDSSSSSTTSGSTLSTSTTSASSSSTTASSATSNSCFDYSTSLTSACWVQSASKTCSDTTATASSCASGMYCTTDSAGGDICMVKDNHLTTSGLAVAIVFGTAVGTFLITMLTCACRDSKAESRRKNAANAALEAEAKNAAAAFDMEAAKRRGSRVLSMGPLSPKVAAANIAPARSRSPLSNTLGADGNEDTRNLLGGSRQPSPSPSLGQQGQRSLTGGAGGYSTGGSSPSSPSRSEEGAYNEARR